jgi:hypothetical protein
MKKKLVFGLWVTVFTLFLAVVAAELLFKLNLLGPRVKYHLTVQPHDLFKTDSLLGWKLNTGKYTLCVWDTANNFIVTIDSLGNRLTSSPGSNTQKECIQVYGCSFTFGFSVNDSATSCYKLQQMMPDARVENKGVPAYGLAQMLLSLQQALKTGDTPSIAIFNYAVFHDVRTPLNKNWSARTVRAITEGYNPRFKDMNYPYLDFTGDSMEWHYCAERDLSRDWPGSDELALIKLVNVAIYGVHDKLVDRHLHQVSVKTALAIAQYCRTNHIIPVFASLTPGPNEVFDSLAVHGFYTLDYGITVWNHYQPNQYNCAPLDPEHPNGRAHSIYAKKLFDFIKANGLLNGR